MISKVTSKGQITIPVETRDKMGIEVGDEIQFVEENGRIYLSKVVKESPLDKWVGYLRHLDKDTDELMNELRGEFKD